MRPFVVGMLVVTLAGCGGDDSAPSGGDDSESSGGDDSASSDGATACTAFASSADSVVFFVRGTADPAVHAFEQGPGSRPGVSVQVLTESDARDRFGPLLSESARQELGSVVLEDWTDLQDPERGDRVMVVADERTSVNLWEDDRLRLDLAEQGVEVVIVFRLDAPVEAIESVRDSIAAREEVAEVVYTDQDDAYAELTEVYADSPQFVDSIVPEFLPRSIRITTESGRIEDIATIGAEFDDAGWANVVQYTDPATYLWWHAPELARELQGCGPLDPLERVSLQPEGDDGADEAAGEVGETMVAGTHTVTLEEWQTAAGADVPASVSAEAASLGSGELAAAEVRVCIDNDTSTSFLEQVGYTDFMLVLDDGTTAAAVAGDDPWASNVPDSHCAIGDLFYFIPAGRSAVALNLTEPAAQFLLP